MNFLKKKLKPLTSGLTNTANQAAASQQGKRGAGQATNKNLEEDLYDDYVVEAPPHPSELLALGVEPTEIDVNDPDKLRELYRKVLEEGKDKKTNSVLLARQRQKAELEEKKRTREEWKYFESLTTRVEQVVKSSQKNLDTWRESSTIDKLTEPDYELRQTADEVFKPVNASKIEKDADHWVDFSEDQASSVADKKEGASNVSDKAGEGADNAKQVDEFGCPIAERKASETNTFVVNALLEDFGIDLRSEKQKRALEEKRRLEAEQVERRKLEEAEAHARAKNSSQLADIKLVARPRPRPRPAAGGGSEQEPSAPQSAAPIATTKTAEELDPFDTSFVAPVVASEEFLQLEPPDSENQQSSEAVAFVDPFDTSHVNL